MLRNKRCMFATSGCFQITASKFFLPFCFGELLCLCFSKHIGESTNGDILCAFQNIFGLLFGFTALCDLRNRRPFGCFSNRSRSLYISECHTWWWEVADLGIHTHIWTLPGLKIFWYISEKMCNLQGCYSIQAVHRILMILFCETCRLIKSSSS